MRFTAYTAIVVATLAATVSVALAQSEERNRTLCYSLGNENYKDPAKYDDGLNACSRLINTPAVKKNVKALAAAYRARGSWKEKKKDYQSALEDFNTAIRLEPRHVESYDYRADVYQSLGDFDKALTDYNMATRIDPTYAAAYFSRGLIFEKQGKIEQAKAEYNAALAVPNVNRIAEWAQNNARVRLKALSAPPKN